MGVRADGEGYGRFKEMSGFRVSSGDGRGCFQGHQGVPYWGCGGGKDNILGYRGGLGGFGGEKGDLLGGSDVLLLFGHGNVVEIDVDDARFSRPHFGT